MGKEMLDAWYYEVVRRFFESKGRGSYGKIPLNQMSSYIKIATSATPTFYSAGFELPRKPYASRKYIRSYPMTFVKEGDLKRLMRSRGAWSRHSSLPSREVSVRVDIPLAIDPDKPIDVYQDLEANRSFIKSSFIMAWPEILKTIMDKLS